MKLTMIIDKRRCFGCQACTVACKVTNATPAGTLWTKTRVAEHGTFPNSHMEFMPLICMHCDNAPCVEVCPTGSSVKQQDGTVQINTETCIGCMSCMEVCPYGARYFNGEEKPTYWKEVGKQDEYEAARSKEHPINTVGKCTFCKSRRAQGQPPACVQTCTAVARIFGDLDDPNSEVYKVYKQYRPKAYKAEEGTVPNVFYIE